MVTRTQRYEKPIWNSTFTLLLGDRQKIGVLAAVSSSKPMVNLIDIDTKNLLPVSAQIVELANQRPELQTPVAFKQAEGWKLAAPSDHFLGDAKDCIECQAKNGEVTSAWG